MSALSPCQRCHGFVPPTLSDCVHCGAPMPVLPGSRGWMQGLMGLAGAGVAAITLRACYGAPPCVESAPDGGSGPSSCYGNPPEEEDGGLPGDGGMRAPDAGADAGR